MDKIGNIDVDCNWLVACLEKKVALCALCSFKVSRVLHTAAEAKHIHNNPIESFVAVTAGH